ncbi:MULTISPECIES: PilN domain-containing protein [Cellulomonas]|uniref:PilN domain-containing protein n=1 Tax=Cellulomonas TaxID=1707 RepID=UPI0010A8E925|nr:MULTISPECIES: PilN domain-containing protein [Cellulomonas]
MSTLTVRRGRQTSAQTALPPTLPQVNLLPPEVRDARDLRAMKRWLLLAVALVVAVCALAYVFVVIQGTQARDELARAEAETARLQDEQAQYAEVPLVLGQLNATRAARELGMSTEVPWKPYYEAITAVLPEGVSIDTLAFSGATPITAPAPPADPLQGPSVGQVQFTGRSSTVPDAAAWVDALNSVPGFADAWVSSAAVTDAEGTVYYTVSSTVQVTEAAYSGRFAANDGEG